MKKENKKHKKAVRIARITLILLGVLGVITLTVDTFTSAASYPKGDKKMTTITSSPQYKDGKFRNAVAWKLPPAGRYISTMWKFLFSGQQRVPKEELPRRGVNPDYFNADGNNQLNVTWLGHSSLMINLDGYKILTDPVLVKRISLVGPSRYNGKIPLDLAALPDIDVVIISHNHYDHLNKYSLRFLNHKVKQFIVPLAVGAQLEKWGIPGEKIVELDWWDEYIINNQLMIAATPAQHFSGRGLSDRDKTLWASFVIAGPNHKIFFSGDSGYFNGFKEIGKKYGPFQMTLIECGAYNENWHHIHMYPEETVRAHLDLGGQVLHPIHWGTFNLSLHAWYDPMQRVSEAALRSGVQLVTPMVGDTTVYGEYLPSQQWWPTMDKSPSTPDKFKNRGLIEIKN